ncbi:MAG: hypothetical protein IJP44_11640 [Bacteroidales bacterium]|nr:hypothetical protein [Bacteroidales bacterium]
MKNPLIQFGNIPVDFAAVASLFPEIKCKHNKVSALEKKGDLIRLKQGMYVVHPDVSQKTLSLFLIGNNLYGPSYISLQSALRYYGLIPEHVFTICSMTTKPTQIFYNSMARFEYVHTDATLFPIGLREETICDGMTVLMASPEKALCDLIADISHLNLRYRKEILVWLEEDVRFDMDELFHFDTGILREYAKVGKKKTMIEQLIKIIES